MTRNEALKIVKDNFEPMLNTAEEFISTLEALGLIKFDEEKQIDSPQMIIRNNLAVDGHYFQPMNKAFNIVDALYLAGYIIARKGD